MANQYRLITILSTAAGEEGIASLTDTIKAKIESGATIDAFDALGTRELAYEIEGQRNGYSLRKLSVFSRLLMALSVISLLVSVSNHLRQEGNSK